MRLEEAYLRFAVLNERPLLQPAVQFDLVDLRQFSPTGSKRKQPRRKRCRAQDHKK